MGCLRHRWLLPLTYVPSERYTPSPKTGSWQSAVASNSIRTRNGAPGWKTFVAAPSPLKSSTFPVLISPDPQRG